MKCLLIALLLAGCDLPDSPAEKCAKAVCPQGLSPIWRYKDGFCECAIVATRATEAAP